MENTLKEWLVRTRRGGVLGPFTQEELIEEFEKATFSNADEISPSYGPWVSAQVLTDRHSEELTHTSTNQTHSTATTSSITREPVIEEVSAATEDKELLDVIKTRNPVEKKKGLSIVLGVLFLLVISMLVIPKGKDLENKVSRSQSSENDRFLSNITDLINTGQKQLALQKLTEYHQQAIPQKTLDYLIPYSALLITEEEAFSRAEKYLNLILNSETASQGLKAEAHQWMGYSYLSKEPLSDLAENHFLEALQVNPKMASVRYNLGRYYLKQKKYSQSLDYLQLAELEMPNLWLIHIYKGRAKVELSSRDEARASFKMAVSLEPDRWLSYIYYALFLMGNREQEEARNCLRRMLSKDPYFEINSPAPFGFYQEKIKYADYLKAFLQITKGGSSVERETGKLYLSYLNSPDSVDNHEKWAPLLDKEDFWPKLLYLKALVSDASTPDSLLRQVLQRVPQNINDFGYYGYVIRAEAKMRLKNYSEAQLDVQKALSLDPKAAVARLTNVRLLKHLGKNKEAEGEIKTLLSYHPNYIPALIASIP
jgi:tetratricopeptide (TPR) repeat protein